MKRYTINNYKDELKYGVKLNEDIVGETNVLIKLEMYIVELEELILERI